jgi:thiosulfate/3-mercaptopyruvate sulfurtransferase
MYTTLISAAELACQMNTLTTVVLDCRHDLMDAHAGQYAYDQSHLPAAQFANMDQKLSGEKRTVEGEFNGRHPLPEMNEFIQTLRAWGINSDTQVVAYDAHGGMYAARLWWMLRWVGHHAVAVLDGGFQAWNTLALPVTDQLAKVDPGDIVIRKSLVAQVGVDEVRANLTSGLRIVVDARSPDRYRGENETIDPVGGHIPGAKNRFFKDNLQLDGSFKPSQQLQLEWRKIVADASQAIMQCGSGVTACHNLLALEIAGLHGAALYPGSWSEWCTDPARPIARGIEAD